MRKLLFKDTTSWKDKKRDVFVEETITKNGIVARTTRRCLYFIKDRIYIKDPNDIKKFAALHTDGNNDNNKRHFHVLKQHNTKQNLDKMMCKVAGTFYAMINNYLYCIVFVHTFRIAFSNKKQ